MAATTLSNIDFQSSTFKDIMAGEFTDRLGLLSSGVMESVNDSIVSSTDKGTTVSLPSWNTISGDSVSITGSFSTTVNSLGTRLDKAVWCEREKAWGAESIIKTVSGADPTAEVARQLAQYLANETHAMGIATLSGVFAVELASTHSTENEFSGATIGNDGVIAAKQLLGDNADMLKVALMHSKVHSDAVTNNMISNQIFNVSNEVFRSGMIGQMLGLIPSVSDKFTATASVYPTYLAAPGSIIYKFRERPAMQENNANLTVIRAGNIVAELEKVRVSLTNGGQDVLVVRFSALTHVPGVYWDGTVTTPPTNTELATASSWTKISGIDDKLIKIVQLNTL